MENGCPPQLRCRPSSTPAGLCHLLMAWCPQYPQAGGSECALKAPAWAQLWGARACAMGRGLTAGDFIHSPETWMPESLLLLLVALGWARAVLSLPSPASPSP